VSQQYRVLIIVQNLPVPLDRRVWLECRALRDAGYGVSVICPKGPGDPDYQVIEGIEVHKYDPSPQAHGLPGYAREFAESWWKTARIARSVWKTRGFRVIQACNPPDTYWALARLYQRKGVLFVYDQHDLNPELLVSRFGEPRTWARRMQYRGLRWLERQTYTTADHVIVTNRSYAGVAEDRGGRDPDDVTVVRSGPDTDDMRPVRASGLLCPPGKSIVVYLGIMGPQDGVDILLHAMAKIVHERGRTDICAALLGFGDCLEDLKSLAGDLAIEDHVRFTGRADSVMISDYLSAATLAVGPDPKSPLNDLSTMNKIMEYMAYALPVVASDLRETRESAGDAAVYVRPGDVEELADQIVALVDDPERRAELGMAARRRVSAILDWRPQARQYVGVFDRLLGVEREVQVREWPEHDRRRRQVPLDELRDSQGRPMANLRDDEEFREFVINRNVGRE
jgi:glycosyltransferase involved in cell wall biosynthesis